MIPYLVPCKKNKVLNDIYFMQQPRPPNRMDGSSSMILKF